MPEGPTHYLECHGCGEIFEEFSAALAHFPHEGPDSDYCEQNSFGIVPAAEVI